MSRTWRVRPSEFYGITDEIAGHYFDRAITVWGLAYEADLNAATSDAKSTADAKRASRLVQQRWMDDSDNPGIRSAAPDKPEVPARPTQFRDPMNAFNKAKEQRG